MTPELTDDDKAILAELLRETIARDRFPLSPGGGPAIFVAPSSPPILGPAPLSPRVQSFKAILAKLDPRGPPQD
jgi:hypothetical protein